MTIRGLVSGLLTAVLGLSGTHAGAADAGTAPLELSPETRELLRTEMREITRAMESLIPAIAEGRWDAVAETGDHIASSFVLEQELSAAQRQELENALPAHFRQLDRKFHIDAGKLGSAARQQDIDLVTFRLYQLVSTCTACHAEYARSVFPGYIIGEKPASGATSPH